MSMMKSCLTTETVDQSSHTRKHSNSLIDTNTFGRITVDQTIEKTVNKTTQTAGTLYQVFKKTIPRLDQNQHLMI